MVHVDISPYVEHLRRDLLQAAGAADDELRQAAERLGYALDPSARLALMEAISQACAEITAEMPAGGVDVRLDGRELAFVVDAPIEIPAAPTPPSPPIPPAAPAADEGEDGVARITLRVPESVKTRAEDAAAAAGQSLNTWLVNAVRRATTDDTALDIDLDLGSTPYGAGPFGARIRTRGSAGRRMTGWA